MSIKKCILFAFLCFISVSIQAFDKTDSLLSIYNNPATPDSIKFKVLNRIGHSYRFREPDSAMIYYELLLQLSKELKNDKEEYYALNNLAICHHIKTEYNLAMDYFVKGLNKAKSVNYKEEIATSLNNIGLLQSDLGDYRNAIDSFMKSITMREKEGDINKTAGTYNNVAAIYMDLEEYDKAEEFLKKALEIVQSSNHPESSTPMLVNIGIINTKIGRYDEALKFYKNALPFLKKKNDAYNLAKTYLNIGVVFDSKHIYDSALYYYNKSLEIREILQDQSGIGSVYYHMSMVYSNMNNDSTALFYAIKASDIATEYSGLLENQRVSQRLYKTYKELGQYRKALDMFELSVTLADSIDSEENLNAVIRQEVKYAYDKKKATDSIAFVKQQEIKDLKIEQQEAQLSSERTQRILLSIGLVLVTLLAVFWYKNYLLKIKTAKIIASQKAKVESQRDKIQDQKDTLQAMNEEVISLNDNLEKIVAERTEKLKRSLSDINDHHFNLVHKIRAPLASLLGLIDLINKEGSSLDEKLELLEIIQTNSIKIDEVIKNMSEKLSKYDTLKI